MKKPPKVSTKNPIPADGDGIIKPPIKCEICGNIVSPSSKPYHPGCKTKYEKNRPGQKKHLTDEL